MLIDGGPESIYERHLGPELRRLVASAGQLDLVVLSHVDEDHAVGLLDFLGDLRAQAPVADGFHLDIDAIWHNTFNRAEGGPDIQARLRTLIASSSQQSVLATSGFELQGIGQGEQLERMAALLKIPVNTGFANGLICVDDAPASRDIANLNLRVVGPTRANLAELKAQWLSWLDRNEPDIAIADVFVTANADRSVPNLSSIMILAEADNKTLLLTGDGRSDHLVQGLRTAGLLDAQGRMHVDVLKVAHHGSDRNGSKAFFRNVTADTYVISANGKDDNPDLATLIWIVETAHAAQRQISIVLTNPTRSSQQLVDEYPPAEFGYTLAALPAGAHSIALTIA